MGPVIVRGHDIRAFSEVIGIVLPGVSRSAAIEAKFFTSGEDWIASGEEMVSIEDDLRPCAWWVTSVGSAGEAVPYDRQIFSYESPGFGFSVDSVAYMRARMSA